MSSRDKERNRERKNLIKKTGFKELTKSDLINLIERTFEDSPKTIACLTTYEYYQESPEQFLVFNKNLKV